MHLKTIDYKGASVQIASFEVKDGFCEYHMMVHVSEHGTFEKQLESVHSAFDAVLASECSDSRPVFMRYFLSDVSNQAEILEEALEERQVCSVSIIGQPPLDGTKVALWAYVVSDVVPMCCGDGLWSAEYFGYTHLWLGNACGKGCASEEQTKMLMDSYAGVLESHGCNIQDNCLRTWFFVQDVDVNYAGVVKGRKERFDMIGLTKESHYLASTGIAGNNKLMDSSVTLDAYAVSGISEEKVTYIKGATHLNPTHEYGVTFERGTYVDFDDRRHVLISGTASIDNKGTIVHPGDIANQARRIWENVDVLLNEGGCTYDDVMHMIVYLRDIADYEMVRTMFEERFPSHPKVFVWAPVCRPGWLIEMECMAVKPHCCTRP